MAFTLFDKFKKVYTAMTRCYNCGHSEQCKIPKGNTIDSWLRTPEAVCENCGNATLRRVEKVIAPIEAQSPIREVVPSPLQRKRQIARPFQPVQPVQPIQQVQPVQLEPIPRFLPSQPRQQQKQQQQKQQQQQQQQPQKRPIQRPIQREFSQRVDYPVEAPESQQSAQQSEPESSESESIPIPDSFEWKPKKINYWSG